MPLKILVVYVDASVARLIVEALTSMGLLVRSVSTCKEAAALVSQEEFSGIFIDPLMPVGEGCELARQAHQSSGNRNTPLFILTTAPDNYAVARSFEATGTFFLQEPIDLDSLTHLLSGTPVSSGEDRRRKKRIALQTEVIRRSLSLESAAKSFDLSEDGILFQDDGSLAMGNKVQLTFSLPDHKPPMDVEGIVARVDSGNRVLVCFTQITPQDRGRINNFLSGRATVNSGINRRN